MSVEMEIFKRRGRKFLCTFLPFLIRKQKGVTTPDHWDQHSTDLFKDIGPASQALLDEIEEISTSKNTSILDMGCNVGRHLNYLYERGYTSLHGVDFSARAISDMKDRYPELYQCADLVVSSFQDYLDAQQGQVDIVYSRGATFELVHPSYPLIRKVAEHAKDYVVLVISESAHSYPRFWEYEFAKNGFELMHLKRPASMEKEDHRVSLMTFRRL